MKLFGKSTVILAIVFVLLMSLSVSVYADDSDLDGWKDEATDSSSLDGVNTSVLNIGKAADNLVKTVAYILISITVTVIGMRFFSTKNATKKEENKSNAMYLVLGTVIIFAGLTVLQKIADIAINAL